MTISLLSLSWFDSPAPVFSVRAGCFGNFGKCCTSIQNNNKKKLIFILRKIHVNMIKCALHESKLSTLISYPEVAENQIADVLVELKLCKLKPEEQRTF